MDERATAAVRGHLEALVTGAAYWPVFAANGKDRVTVRHALTHRAGVPLLPLAIGALAAAFLARAFAFVFGPAGVRPAGES
jgi:CubicO group peptidase (beta-lactamase class C family)